MIHVRVKLFAMIREIVGKEEIVVPVPANSSIDRCVEEVVGKHPGVTPWRPYLRFALNNEYVDGKILLRDGDELAVIPPVSGG